MKNKIRKIDKYPDREKFVANFAITDWLEDRYKMVLKEGNKKRIGLYKDLTPVRVLVEEPYVLDRDESYFRSTIIARKNGLLFPDPKITFPTFEDFLNHTDPDKILFNREGIPTELTYDDLNQLAKDTNDFPESPDYAITKIKETNEYALLVFSESFLLDLDEIIKIVFKEYLFQNIEGFSLENEDSNFPAKHQSDINGYITGKVTLNDVLLFEKSITVNFLNIKLIKKLMDLYEYFYNGEYTYNGAVTYSSVIL